MDMENGNYAHTHTRTYKCIVNINKQTKNKQKTWKKNDNTLDKAFSWWLYHTVIYIIQLVISYSQFTSIFVSSLQVYLLSVYKYFYYQFTSIFISFLVSLLTN